MVDLSSGLHHQSIDNSFFILPAFVVIVVMGYVSYKLKSSICEKQSRLEEKRRRREERKEKKN